MDMWQKLSMIFFVLASLCLFRIAHMNEEFDFLKYDFR